MRDRLLDATGALLLAAIYACGLLNGYLAWGTP